MAQPEDRYRGEAGRGYHEGKRAVPEAAYAWVARSRALKLSPHVGLEDVVLEYGVGFGWNLAALPCRRRLGFDVAEVVEGTVRQHGIEFFARATDLPEGEADVVLCHHTLEHVIDPPRLLRDLAGFLRPEGRLLLYVPWERERRLRRFRRGERNHHFYTWSVQSLGNLVEECGYEVLGARSLCYGYDRFASVWACRLRMGEHGFRLLRRALQLIRPLREVGLEARRRRSAAVEGNPSAGRRSLREGEVAGQEG